jgi:hypothetical protein
MGMTLVQLGYQYMIIYVVESEINDTLTTLVFTRPPYMAAANLKP